MKVILSELVDRKGFDWWWDDLDEEIQTDIEAVLRDIVFQILHDPERG